MLQMSQYLAATDYALREAPPRTTGEAGFDDAAVLRAGAGVFAANKIQFPGWQ
jgi:hypothetical protein